MILDIGVGEHPRGDINLDIKKSPYCNLIGRAEHLPFREDVFDLIICSQVLEHLPSPLLAVKEINRVLKINGIAKLDYPRKIFTNNSLSRLIQFVLNFPFSLFRIGMIRDCLREYKTQNPRHFHRSIIETEKIGSFLDVSDVREDRDVFMTFLVSGRKRKYFERIKPKIMQNVYLTCTKRIAN